MPIGFSVDLIEENGIVNGYSITNHNNENETKSEIQGLYFEEDKSFQLQETQIIYTKSEAPINSFCYIRMNLKLKNRFTKKSQKVILLVIFQTAHFVQMVEYF